MERMSKGLAIAIRSEKRKDSDRMLTLLSPDMGLVKVISYGARKSIRALKAPLYTEGIFALERIGQSDFWTIKDVDVISTHERISETLESSMAAALFSEIVITSRSFGPAVYQTYCKALDLLESFGAEASAIAFFVAFLPLTGFIGDWEKCPVCGNEYTDDEILGFSASEGVPVCHRCDTMSEALILPPNARHYIKRVQEVGMEEAMELGISDMQRHRIFRYFLRLLKLSYPGKLKSLESGVWDIFVEDL